MAVRRPVQREPRGGQGRVAIVGERTAHGVAVAPGDLGFRVRPLCQLPCKGAHAADPLFARLLGVAVGLIDGFGRFTQGGEMAGAYAGQLPGLWRWRSGWRAARRR